MKHPLLKQYINKCIALVTAISLLVQMVFPIKLSAMSGPAQPEYSSFQPVNSSGLVSDFTGEFKYNVPLLDIPGTDGGGYALGLSYQSGTNPEDDGSWVGYGWTLNPGAIVRNKRGFADDIKDGSLVRYNYNETPNFTITLGQNGASAEAFGASVSGGVNQVLSYNSYSGLSYQALPFVGTNLGLVSLEAQSTKEGVNVDFSISPAGLISSVMKCVSSIASVTGTKGGQTMTPMKCVTTNLIANGNALIRGGHQVNLRHIHYTTIIIKPIFQNILLIIMQ